MSASTSISFKSYGHPVYPYKAISHPFFCNVSFTFLSPLATAEALKPYSLIILYRSSNSVNASKFKITNGVLITFFNSESISFIFLGMLY